MAQSSAAPRHVDLEGAATYLGISTRTVRRLAHERRIPHLRVGRRLRFELADLEAFLARCRVEATG